MVSNGSDGVIDNIDFNWPEREGGDSTSGQKRQREQSSSSDVSQTSDSEAAHIPRPSRKRQHRSHLTHEDNVEPRHLVVHQVTCSPQAAPGHSHHHHAARYLDQPRLFEGDNKASSLRGEQPIGNLDDYLDDHPETSFMVTRGYSCVAYHDQVRDDFEKLPIPSLPGDAAGHLRPYFFVLRQNGPAADPESESVRVVSDHLQNAMGILRLHEPSLLDDWDSGRNLVAPYLQLYHARSPVKALLRNELDGIQQAYASELMAYLEESFSNEYDDANLLFAQGLVDRAHLNKLFSPAEVVVTHTGSEPVAYVSRTCPEPDAAVITLNAYTWVFDGSFRREERELTVSWPPGSGHIIPITSLGVYPLRFDHSGLRESLRKRGETFWSCRKRKFVGYRSPATTFEMQVANPRYMVDISMYRELHKEENQSGDQGELDAEAMDRDEPPEEPFVLLLPPRILGFGMHDKKWKSLLVEHIREIQWNKKAFKDQLVLEGHKKDLMEALVRNHLSSRVSTDVIEGKGNGLIILLHGGPGTGKTLTAESVAELAEKPLYRVTCGDMGTDAESVERYLDSVLYIGSIWKAVILLDESDVFLEERTQTDLKRNALVSIFLRVLEYYDGILILTSNRVGIFDEAFKSRVQLALHYPPIDHKGRREIWSNFFVLLEKQDDTIKSDDLMDKLHILAGHELNGREIRNAIATGRQLAKFRKEPLGYSHLDQTIKVANEFNEYVEKTHGHRDSEYVRAQGTRLE